MHCINCGAELPEGAAFCGSCGTKVVRTDTENPVYVSSDVNNTTVQKQKIPVVVIAVVAVLIVGIAAGGIFFLLGNRTSVSTDSGKEVLVSESQQTGEGGQMSSESVTASPAENTTSSDGAESETEEITEPEQVSFLASAYGSWENDGGEGEWSENIRYDDNFNIVYHSSRNFNKWDESSNSFSSLYEYVYDDQNRIIRESYNSESEYDGSGSTDWYTADYSYDDHGNVTEERKERADGSVSVWIKEYDEQDRIIKEFYSNGRAYGDYTWQYSYDERGNVTESRQEHADGSVFVWIKEYDEQDRIIKEFYSNYGEDYDYSYVMSYSYDEHGNRTESRQEHANGSCEVNLWNYDETDRLLLYKNFNLAADSSTIYQCENIYTYEEDGSYWEYDSYWEDSRSWLTKYNADGDLLASFSIDEAIGSIYSSEIHEYYETFQEKLENVYYNTLPEYSNIFNISEENREMVTINGRDYWYDPDYEPYECFYRYLYDEQGNLVETYEEDNLTESCRYVYDKAGNILEREQTNYDYNSEQEQAYHSYESYTYLYR